VSHSNGWCVLCGIHSDTLDYSDTDYTGLCPTLTVGVFCVESVVRPGRSNIKGIQEGGIRWAIKVRRKCNKDVEEERQEIRNTPGG
jgi:hypothetical protein